MTVATDTIGGAYLVEGQAQKEARTNEWFDQLALNLAGYLSKDVAGAGTVTLTDTIGGEAHHAVLVFTGTLTGNRIVEVPAATRSYLVRNATTGAFTLTVQTAAGAGVAVVQGTWADLVCDGTDVLAALTSTGGITPGTPFSVVRYAASGTALAAAPTTIIDANGRTGLGTLTPDPGYRHTITGTTLSDLALTVSNQVTATNNQGQVMGITRRTTSDMTDGFGTVLSFYIADNAGVDHQIGQLLFKRQGADNSGRFLVKTINAGAIPSQTVPGDLAVDPVGNVSLNADVLSCGGTHVLALGPGTAPSSSVADTVLLAAGDRGAVAGKGSLHLRTEDGTSHVLGDLSGIGTTLTATLGSGASYQALTVKGSQLLVGQSSVQERPQALLAPSWVVSTDATRSGRLTLSVYDATAAREGLRLEADGSAPRLGFFGGSAVAKPTVTGAKGGNVALGSLLSALSSLGLVTDSSTA